MFPVIRYSCIATFRHFQKLFISTGASVSVAAGTYLFDIPIFDAEDNPAGTPIGSSVTISIEKDGATLDSDTFMVEAGGVTRIDFSLDIASSPARTGGTDYYTVALAYDQVVDGGAIFVKSSNCVGDLQETLVFDRADSPVINLLGGCDDNFSPGDGSTILGPSLTVSHATVIIENIILQ